VSVANRAPKRTISAAGVEATVATEKPVETVSVLHTLKKERDILSRFVDDVRPDDAVLDVGANLGVFSALAGQRARDVTAVEPHPRTADRCRENLARNGVDGDVLTAAVGAGPGTIGLAVDQDAVGTQRPEIASDGAYDVPMIPADRLGEVDVVKVDVEGAEQHVLDGMARMLAECPPRVIYVEAHDDADARSLRDRLEAAEYRVETVAVANQQYLRAAR